jgi:hypothetical protein
LHKTSKSATNNILLVFTIYAYIILAVANRPIRIGWAQKNTNLFIGDLDPSVTNEMLREAFKAFGDIIEDETFAKNQNYGYNYKVVVIIAVANIR